MENSDSDKEKPRSLAGEALNSLEKMAHEHPQFEAGVIAGAGIAVGLIANRFHVSGVVERLFPKAAELLGVGTEDLLQAHATSERLPKLLTRLHNAESFNLLGREIAAKPLTVDRVLEVGAKPEAAGFFAKPVLTENADAVAAIFAKHMDSPEWNALSRARSEAQRAVDTAGEDLLKLPEGTPYTTDPEKIRALMFDHHGEDGLTKLDAMNAALAHREALAAQSSAPERLPILQNAFDELSDKFSLPRVNVQFDKDLDALGMHYFGTNDVLVKQSHLESENYARLFGTSAHEFTHVEEASLIVRRIADKLGVGSEATPEQLKLLQDAFKAEAGPPLTADFAAGVLKVRNGRLLSYDENVRAENILQGYVSDRNRLFENHLAESEMSKLTELQDDVHAKPTWKILSEYHGQHLSPESEATLEREDVLRWIVRQRNPEFDRLVKTLEVDETGKPVAWSDDADLAARKSLTAFLEPRMDVLHDLLEEHKKGYYASFHEQEAHGTSAAVYDAFNRLSQ